MQELLDLVRGYKEFSTKERRDGQYGYSGLSEGQSPKVMIVSCSDSRVIPSQIFNVEPGDFFVVRNIANLVPAFSQNESYHGTSAALEYAVLELKVEHIIVMGHSQCGGIKACDHNHLHNTSTSYFVDQWLSILASTVERVHVQHKHAAQSDRLRILGMEAIKTSVENLRTFPFIAEAIEKNLMGIHGAYFDIRDGQLYMLDKTSGVFQTVD